MIGRAIGHYRVTQKLGAGGMGEVYLAHDERLDRDVAIKVLPASTFADEPARKRFRREALTLAKLNHPHIATVHEFETLEHVDYLVMEYVPGSSLADTVMARPLPERDVISIAAQIADALEEAHQHGIVHRDLKPQNIRLTPKGHIKVLDFGLATWAPSQATEARTESAVEIPALAGTLPYMSPEQLRGQSADARSDIWSFGVVLHEMATGLRPFDSKVNTALVADIQTRQPAPPRSINNRISLELERIILKCLEKDPGSRYQSAKELAVDLRRLGSSSLVVSPVIAKPKQAWVAGVGGLALLFALAIATNVGGLRQRFSAGSSSATPANPIRSLAILPLDNVSGDSAQDYFAEAMTEEITNQMASLPLRVISRTSASRYRGASKSLREIARELQVDALIEGSVFRSGDQVRITVQLIRGDTDQHIWSKSYQRASTNLIGLQGEVAQAIAHEIQLALSPAEQRRLELPPTRNPRAYEAYLRASYHLRTPLASEKIADDAIASAEQAIAFDPEFAEAYVALARACVAKIFGFGGGSSYDERAFVALGKAIALKPDLADAYGVRGLLYFTQLHNFDIARAVADYRRAVQLNPNSAEAHHNLGSEYTHAGLHEKAIDEFRASLRLDPHQNASKFRTGRALWQSGRFQEALQHYERNNIVNFEHAWTLACLGRREEAMVILERAQAQAAQASAHRNVSGQLSDLSAVRAFLYATESKPRDAEHQIQRAAKLGKEFAHFHHAAFMIAAAYAEMGKPHQAVTWLRHASDTGMPNFPLFRDNPSIRKLQGNPEFDQFMAQLKARWEELAAALQQM